MDVSELREFGLIGGGECFAHFHPHIVTLDAFQRAQQLENIVFTSVNYTCRGEDDIIFVDSTAGAITVTLPDSSGKQRITVSRIAGANSVVVAVVAGETINLTTSVTITASFTPRRFKGVFSSSFAVKGYLEI